MRGPELEELDELDLREELDIPEGLEDPGGLVIDRDDCEEFDDGPDPIGLGDRDELEDRGTVIEMDDMALPPGRLWFRTESVDARRACR